MTKHRKLLIKIKLKMARRHQGYFIWSKSATCVGMKKIVISAQRTPRADRWVETQTGDRRYPAFTQYNYNSLYKNEALFKANYAYRRIKVYLRIFCSRRNTLSRTFQLWMQLAWSRLPYVSRRKMAGFYFCHRRTSNRFCPAQHQQSRVLFGGFLVLT